SNSVALKRIVSIVGPTNRHGRQPIEETVSIRRDASRARGEGSPEQACPEETIIWQAGSVPAEADEKTLKWLERGRSSASSPKFVGQTPGSFPYGRSAVPVENARERAREKRGEQSAGCGNPGVQRPEGCRRHVLVESAQPADGDVGEKQREKRHAHHGGLDGGRRRAR